MKKLRFKYTLLTASISIFTCMPSCYELEPPGPPRPVSCEMPEDYNYMDYYERWRGPICTTELCSTYTSVWKELLIDRTTLTEPYFDNHFEIWDSKIMSDSEGDFFVVGYQVQNDWAIAFWADWFIIKIAEESTEFPEIGLPKGDYLSKEQIAAALDHRGFDSRIKNVPKTGPLKFSSRDEALNVLISEANVDTLCFYRVTLDHNIGTLTLKAYARYIDVEDECFEGSIDLITGSIILRDKKCSNGYDR